jgi:hypothetical protein
MNEEGERGERNAHEVEGTVIVASEKAKSAPCEIFFLLPFDLDVLFRAFAIHRH